MARQAIAAMIDRRVRARARRRCGYCLAPQHLVMARIEIEHVLPLAKGGSDDERNLWLACPLCNGHKADKTEARDPETGILVALFNPCRQRWSERCRWSDDGIRIIGITPVGRATVLALHLSDDPDALTVRAYLVLAGWHPPAE